MKSIKHISDSISLSSPVACASPKELEGPPVPANVASLPDELRSSLLGRYPALKMTRRRRAMVIYVCAADSQGETEILNINCNTKNTYIHTYYHTSCL